MNSISKQYLKKHYSTDLAVIKPFGTLVEEILLAEGITKKQHGKTVIDYKRASARTGLNENIFRVTMHKPDCTIKLPLVISLCIGLNLSSDLTNQLISAAGLSIRICNPDHRAYLFLLENRMEHGSSIVRCNEILKDAGVKPSRRLGSCGRGKDGEPGYYKDYE